MDNIHPMCGHQSRSHLYCNVECVINVHTGPKPLAQRLTFNEFSGDEAMVIRFADFMNRENVRMIQSGGRPRLLFKTAQPFGIFCEVSGKQL